MRVAPALIATFEDVSQHNSAAIHMSISSGSEILSVTSSKERQRRVQLAKAREETARLRLELAEAREAVAQTELDHTLASSEAGSVGRLADVRSDGGTSTRARQRSSAELAVPLIQLEEVFETVPLPTTQESSENRSSVKMESEAAQGHTFVLQHNFANDGCHIGPQTATTWQDNHVAVEHVVSIAEVRHEEAFFNMASTTEESHQQAMAQLAGEATRALQ